MSKVKDAKIVANDLEIYFKGFGIAIRQKKREDAIYYLKKMSDEIKNNIQFLESAT